MRKKLAKKTGEPARPPPKAVQDLISNDFIRRIRDGGPLAQQSTDLPPTDAAWIDDDSAMTARNVVNALCRRRFGDLVCVDEVIGGPAQARGIEYIVTLSLGDRDLLGSPNSIHLRDFDRDTTAMLEGLKEVEGWRKDIYRLKVQSPGVESDAMRLPEDLWKCEAFPCHVVWEVGSSRYDKYLNIVPGSTNTWRLADTDKNWLKKPQLTREQREKTWTIELEDISRIAVHMDSRSHNKLMKLKEWMKTQNVTDAQRAQLEALGAGDEVAGEEDDDEEEEDDEEESEDDGEPIDIGFEDDDSDDE